MNRPNLAAASACLFGLVFALASTAPADEKSDKKPLKVFVLSGQSNMVGMGKLPSLDKLKDDPNFKYLVDEEGNWVQRDDVYYVSTYLGPVHDWLRPGLANKGKRVGPELGIGHMLGQHFDDKILMIKAAQGNRSLGFDAMSPTSQKRYGIDDRDKQWYHGWQYDQWRDNVKGILANLKDHYPEYDEEAGYEIIGFFWWQGHKDKGMDKEKYAQLLIDFANDFRKDLGAPDALWVTATVAFNGNNLGAWQGVWEAQMATGDPEQQPEDFKGKVTTVDIRDLGGGGFHYGDDAARYTRIGERMGQAMVKLVKANQKDAPAKAPAAAKPEHEFRRWTTTRGLKVEARLVEYADNVAVLQRRFGGPIRLRDTQLSEEDRKYLADLNKPAEEESSESQDDAEAGDQAE